MLEFRTIALEDKEVYEKLTEGIRYPLCEYCFPDLFLWSKHYHVTVCFAGNLFFARSEFDGNYSYCLPIGTGDLRWGIEQIAQDAAHHKNKLHLHAISEEGKNKLESQFPGKFLWQEDRNGSDYIYEAEKLITLQGKKLQSKRNFVNRFRKEYEGRWEYQDIQLSDHKEIYEFHLQWCQVNQTCLEGNQYRGETCAVYRALENWQALGMEGGLLRVDGKIAAFTIGYRHRPDMYIMQFEKADSQIAGAYQMINQQFAIHHFQDVKYVNREEDMGIEGLRKAKMSYYPLEMGKEYRAVWKDEFVWNK